MNEELTGQPVNDPAEGEDLVQEIQETSEEIAEKTIGYNVDPEPLTGQDGYEDLSGVSDMESLLRMADEDSNVSAMFQLGYNYQLGRYTEQDCQQAAEWYGKAAAQGHAAAQYNLSLLYAAGVGVEAEPKQAFYYAHSAAQGGIPQAQAATGYYYLNGYGVCRNIKKALEWSEKAGSNVNVTGIENVAVIRDQFQIGEDGALDARAYRLGVAPIVFFSIGMILSLWMALECVRSFSNGSFLSTVDAGLLLPASLAIIGGSVMVMMRKYRGVYLLMAAVLLYLASLAAGGGQGFFIGFVIPALIGLTSSGKGGGPSLYATTVQDTEIGAFIEDVGYGPRFDPQSSDSKLYKMSVYGAVTLLGAVVVLAAIPLIKSWTGFSLPGNVFKSVLLPVLWVVGFILGLKQKTSTYKTYDVYENKYTGKKRYEESGDIIESMSNSILMPLLERFVFIPLGIAIGIYYVLWLIVKLISGIVPYLLLVMALSMLVGFVMYFLKNISKKNRLALMGTVTLFLACLIWGLLIR